MNIDRAKIAVWQVPVTYRLSSFW